MYTGNPEKTIALMEKVLESVNPESEQAAFLWTAKGLDELLFLGDKEAAIKSYFPISLSPYLPISLSPYFLLQ